DVPRLGARRCPREKEVRMIAAVRRPWSPYLAGVGLGLVVAVSMAVFGHRLRGAGAYQNRSGCVGKLIAPDAMYWQHVVPTGLTWDVLLLIGSLGGAFAAAGFSGTFK